MSRPHTATFTAGAVDNLVRRRGRASATSNTIFGTLAYAGLLAWVVWTMTYLFPGAIQVAVITLAMTAAHLLFSGRLPDVGGRVGAWVLAFFAAAMLSVTTTIWLGRSLEELRELGKLVLIFFLVINVATSPQRLKALLILTVVLIALYPGRGAILNWLSGNVNAPGRAMWKGAFGNPNALSGLVLLFLPLSYAWFRRERQPALKVLWAACFVVPLVAVLLSKSRSGFLGVTLLVGWAVWSAGNRVRAAGGALALALAFLAVAPEGWQERISTIRYSITGETPPEELRSDVGSSTGRLFIWRTAVEIIAQRPITGAGLGTFEEAHKRHTPYWEGRLARKDTHNTFLRVASETGLIGLLAFLGFLGATYKLGMRALRLARSRGTQMSFEAASLEAGLVGLAAFLITNFFNTFANLYFLYMQLGVLVLLARHCLNDTNSHGVAPNAAAHPVVSSRARRSHVRHRRHQI